MILGRRPDIERFLAGEPIRARPFSSTTEIQFP